MIVRYAKPLNMDILPVSNDIPLLKLPVCRILPEREIQKCTSQYPPTHPFLTTIEHATSVFAISFQRCSGRIGALIWRWLRQNDTYTTWLAVPCQDLLLALDLESLWNGLLDFGTDWTNYGLHVCFIDKFQGYEYFNYRLINSPLTYTWH